MVIYFDFYTTPNSIVQWIVTMEPGQPLFPFLLLKNYLNMVTQLFFLFHSSTLYS
jgi:hypothetical protein